MLQQLTKKSSTILASTPIVQRALAATAHTDISVQFPNFDAYRHDKCKDPTGRGSRETEDDRRGAPYAVTYGIGGILSIVTAKAIATHVVDYKSMPADQKALAAIEINLEEVPEGRTKTYEWRSKPIFVKHRTAAEIEKERAVNVADLRHPERDEERCQRPEWSILVGVCTHLGCIPIAGSGEYGGYFCPCHGSHYDASGRIRKGPAPLNLEVPEYEFIGENMVRVGKS